MRDLKSSHSVIDLADYKITADDRFLDIGAGLGKVVLHVAAEVGCASAGIEVVPLRAEAANDLKKTLIM